MSRKSLLWLSVVLIGVFWYTRLIGIQIFPPFLDEVQHVREAEQAFLGHPLAFVGEGRLFSIWWMTLFQPYLGETVWVMRIATLLVVVVGFAAVLGIGKLAAGQWGVIFTGLLYLFSLYHVFFERLALADPVSGAAVSVALYFAFRLSRRVNYRDALLTGIALSIAVGSKATALPYMGIPIVAGLALWTERRTRLENIRWVMIALATEIILVGLYFVALTLFRQNPFGFIALYNAHTTEPILSRTLANLERTVNLAWAYLGVGFLFLLLVSLLIRWRHKWFFLICLLAPALVLWVNERYFSRYYTSVMLIFLLSGALALVKLVEVKRMRVFALILLVMGIHWLGFMIIANTNPVNLPLWSNDYSEYIRSDASGFGIREAKQILIQHRASQVIGALANCDGLYYLSLGQPFTVICPKINPNGTSVDAIADLINRSRTAGTYVVLEDIPYVPASAPGQLIATISRPQDSPALRIYDLSP